MIYIFISLAVYFALCSILTGLNIFGYLSYFTVIIGYIILGALIAIGQIVFYERKKRSLGEKVLRLKGFATVIKIGWTCFWIAFWIMEYRLFSQNTGLWAYLSWGGAMIIILLYITLLSGRFVAEKGLSYDGSVIRWDEIDYLEWQERVRPFFGFSSQLVIRKKKKTLYSRLKMNIHSDQQVNVHTILQQNGCKELEWKEK